MKFKFIYGTNDSEIEQKVNDFLATGVKVIDWKCMHVVDDNEWLGGHYIEFACTYEETK